MDAPWGLRTQSVDEHSRDLCHGRRTSDLSWVCPSTRSGPRRHRRRDPPRPGSSLQTLVSVDGPPAGWVIRNWMDIAQLAPTNAVWTVQDGVLRSGIPRGTWLVAEPEYGDFTLEFDFRLGERGNGAVGLRLPAGGNPSTDALEIRLVDPAFFGANYVAPSQDLTGSLCKLIPPPPPTPSVAPSGIGSSSPAKAPNSSPTSTQVRILDLDLASNTEPPRQGRPLARTPPPRAHRLPGTQPRHRSVGNSQRSPQIIGLNSLNLLFRPSNESCAHCRPGLRQCCRRPASRGPGP